ncbi:MAG: hypothetical protein B6244_04105 [Candidatus Cloacimonetes bacterium 4572_55]|nr:MAG: hypothetical protein B6244_04105 [Candidatus Cloacimonetes bacterium 4572_55]
MKKRLTILSSVWFLFPTILFLTVWVGVSHSQGILREGITINSDFGVGARSMGMGGAHVAAASDVSAMYWNPAGLVFVRRIELSATLTREEYEIKTSFFNTASDRTKKKTRLNSLGLAYPIPTLRGSLVFGMAINRVHSFDRIYAREGYNDILAYNDQNEVVSGDSYEKETQISAGGLYNWSFCGAMDISEQLSLGIALHIWSGDYEGVFELVDTDTEDVWTFHENTLTQEDDFDLDGYSVGFGGVYRANRQLTFGFSLNSKVNLEFDGEQREEKIYVDDDELMSEKVSYYGFEDAEIPWMFNLGSAYTHKMFKLAADVTYMDWSETENVFDIDNLENKHLYDEVLKLRIGGEFLLPNSPIRLRAGVCSDPLPYQGTKIDRDRVYFTGGIGVLLDRVFTIDLAYVSGSWERVNTEYEYQEETKSNRVFVTSSYHF